MRKYVVEYDVVKVAGSIKAESVVMIAEGLRDVAEQWHKYAVHIALCDGVSLDDIRFIRCEVAE